MQGWVWLAIEAALAVVALRVMARRVLPALRVSHGDVDAALLIDVWLPLTLALPMVILAGWVGLEGHRGWTAAVGGPPVLGVFAAALAWLAAAGWGAGGGAGGAAPMPPQQESRTAVLTWSATGALLLLIGAAHQLTIFAGQGAFAIGAVLLWLNTPAENAHHRHSHHRHRQDHHEDDRDDHGVASAAVSAPAAALEHDRLAAATLGAVLLAAGIGACCVIVAGEAAYASLSQTIAMTFAACALAAASRVLGAADLVRVGGWAATYGVLFALGIMSLTKLSPVVTASIMSREALPLPPVARGMGIYAPEAVALLALGGLAFAGGMLGRRVRRVAGAALLILIAAWLAWRLAAIGGAVLFFGRL